MLAGCSQNHRDNKDPARAHSKHNSIGVSQKRRTTYAGQPQPELNLDSAE